MRPEEIADANLRVSTHVATPGDELIIRKVAVPSVVLVLPLAHAEALSACANVGLEGAPDQVVGDLTWAAVSKLDAVVREAKDAEAAPLVERYVADADRVGTLEGGDR